MEAFIENHFILEKSLHVKRYRQGLRLAISNYPPFLLEMIEKRQIGILIIKSMAQGRKVIVGSR